MSVYESGDEIIPGDVVAVRHGIKGRQEGLVVGSHIDYYGRQVIEVQLETGYYHYPYVPGTVTRVRRTISHSRPSGPAKQRTIERRIYW